MSSGKNSDDLASMSMVFVWKQQGLFVPHFFTHTQLNKWSF
jgi:hypothetical protein